MNSSDNQVLLNIRPFCFSLTSLVYQNKTDLEKVISHFDYLLLYYMCIMQIGVLSTHLSDEFKKQHANIPWARLIEMSGKIYTDFLTIKLFDISDLARESIPQLINLCQEILGDQQYEIEPFHLH